MMYCVMKVRRTGVRVRCDTTIAGYLYARALEEHGIKVDYRHYDGAFHALLNFHTHIPVAQTIIDDAVEYALRSVAH